MSFTRKQAKRLKLVCEDDNLDKSKLVVTLDNKKLAEGEDYTIVDDKDGSIAGMLTQKLFLKQKQAVLKKILRLQSVTLQEIRVKRVLITSFFPLIYS